MMIPCHLLILVVENNDDPQYRVVNIGNLCGAHNFSCSIYFLCHMSSRNVNKCFVYILNCYV